MHYADEQERIAASPQCDQEDNIPMRWNSRATSATGRRQALTGVLAGIAAPAMAVSQIAEATTSAISLPLKVNGKQLVTPTAHVWAKR
jgi:hypothetical protein